MAPLPPAAWSPRPDAAVILTVADDVFALVPDDVLVAHRDSVVVPTLPSGDANLAAGIPAPESVR